MHEAHEDQTREKFIVGCALCGQERVVTDTPLNSDLSVCGDCGVEIGLGLAREDQNNVRSYEDAIADIRWLADARDEYTSEEVKPGVMVARLLADILAETVPVIDGGTGFGWLPSWRWDEWDARKSRRGAPAEPAVTDEMVKRATHAAFAAGLCMHLNIYALEPKIRAALEAALSTGRGD